MKEFLSRLDSLLLVSPLIDNNASTEKISAWSKSIKGSDAVIKEFLANVNSNSTLIFKKQEHVPIIDKKDETKESENPFDAYLLDMKGKDEIW